MAKKLTQQNLGRILCGLGGGGGLSSQGFPPNRNF